MATERFFGNRTWVSGFQIKRCGNRPRTPKARGRYINRVEGKNDGKLIGVKGRNKITVFHRAKWEGLEVGKSVVVGTVERFMKLRVMKL